MCGRLHVFSPVSWSEQVRVGCLPTYDPDSAPVPRVWWRLYEGVTRNRRRQMMDDLLKLTSDWFPAVSARLSRRWHRR